MNVRNLMDTTIVMKLTTSLLLLLAMLAFNVSALAEERVPIQTAAHVDLERFMGPWYVIANIPTFVEKDAFNAVESYALNTDGSIATAFTFNKGSFNGKRKKYTPRGFVRDKKSNAIWGMQFIWPFKGDYRIVYIAEDYSLTVIGRQKRDYVWIMARKPIISEEDYQRMVDIAVAQGYDITKIQKVPQQER